MRRLVLLPLVLCLLGPPAAASDAERYRLGQEMQRLAQRNAWRGVERVYADLVKLGTVEVRHHLLAYQAARTRGEIDLAWKRLDLALAAGQDSDDPIMEEVRREHEALAERFGRVSITVVPPRLAVLVSYEKPFAPEERGSLDHARTRLMADQRFEGLLPVGRYMVDGEIFEIQPHGETVQLRVLPPDATAPTTADPATKQADPGAEASADQLPPSR